MLDEDQEQLQPPQRQSQPGIQQEMTPEPDSTRPQHQGSDKLAGKVALITGGDSGIGRAVAVLFAREGADVAIGHLAEEDTDANETVKLVEAEGRRCLTLSGDVGDEAFCQDAVARTVRELGRLDVLVNNAAEQHTTESISEISAEQPVRTFRTNIFAMFFLTKLPLATHPLGRDNLQAVQVQQQRPRRTTLLTHLRPPSCRRHTSASYARPQVLLASCVTVGRPPHHAS
jgi:short chain dehydrogenase